MSAAAPEKAQKAPEKAPEKAQEATGAEIVSAILRSGRSLFHPVDPRMIASAFDSFDADHNGHLDAKETAALLKVLQTTTINMAMTRMHREFSFLARVRGIEAPAISKRLGEAKTAIQGLIDSKDFAEDAQVFINTLDENHDGKLVKDEFCKGFLSLKRQSLPTFQTVQMLSVETLEAAQSDMEIIFLEAQFAAMEAPVNEEKLITVTTFFDVKDAKGVSAWARKYSGQVHGEEHGLELLRISLSADGKSGVITESFCDAKAFAAHAANNGSHRAGLMKQQGEAVSVTRTVVQGTLASPPEGAEYYPSSVGGYSRA